MSKYSINENEERPLKIKNLHFMQDELLALEY
jgi:hypothetical protein